MIKDLLMVNNMETWNALRLHFILSCFQLFWWYIFVFARALKCKIFTAFLLIYGEIESPGNPRSATRLPDTSLTVLTMITIQGSARTQASPPWPLTPWCLRAVCPLIITLLWPDSVSVSGSDGDPGTGPDVPRSWPPVCPRRRAPALASAPAVARYRRSVVHWLSRSADVSRWAPRRSELSTTVI